MHWLQRLRRLYRQSAIRLPRRGLVAADLHIGDRLQIASRWWRIAGSHVEGASLVFELESEPEGQPTRLHADPLPGGAYRWRWTRDQRSLELDSRLLTHFPVRASFPAARFAKLELAPQRDRVARIFSEPPSRQ